MDNRVTKYVWFIISLVFCQSLGMFNAQADQFIFDPLELVVSHDAGYRTAPTCFINQHDQLFFGWSESNRQGGFYNDRVYSMVSEDMGHHWFEWGQVDDDLTFYPGKGLKFGIGNDQSTVSAIFRHENGLECLASVSYDFGKTWPLKNIRVDDGYPSDKLYVSIAGDADHLLATWLDDRNMVAGTTVGLYSSFSIDGGFTWSSPITRIDDSAVSELRAYTHLFQCRDGSFIAYWSDYREYPSVYTSVSTDGGVTWSPNTPVNESNQGTVNQMDMIQAPDGTLFMVYSCCRDIFQVDVRTSYSYDGGYTWIESLEPVNPQTAPYSFNGRITYLSDVGPVVVWTDGVGFNVAIDYISVSLDDGQTWETPQYLLEGYKIWADICALPDGEIFLGLLYSGPPPENNDLYYTIHGQWDNWTPPPATPTPTSTPTFTPSPTPTVPADVDVILNLEMPGNRFGPGSPCELKLSMTNPGPSRFDADLYIALTVGTGDYWFYPSWVQYPPAIDLDTVTILKSSTHEMEIIPEFIWPFGAGEHDGAQFISVLLHEDIVRSNLAEVTFGWTDESLPTPTPTPVPDGFTYVQPGSFEMGEPISNECSYTDYEAPVHTVTLTQPLLVSQTEITQAQWLNVFQENPSYFQGDNRPVERVSWFDACLYCNQLSIMENLEPCYYLDPGFTVIFDGTPPINVGPVYWKTDATGYRLPTEAEWEYLCRAGTTTDFNNGEEAGLFCSSDNFGLLAWYFDNSDYATHDVALKEPNNWNLFDMHGNVWEWVWDGWGLYDDMAVIDPIGPNVSYAKILRGGSYYEYAGYCRVTFRNRINPGNQNPNMGFRIVRMALH